MRLAHTPVACPLKESTEAPLVCRTVDLPFNHSVTKTKRGHTAILVDEDKLTKITHAAEMSQQLLT